MCLPSKLPGKIQERFLKIVVALCGYLIVLQILLPVECNLLCLNLPVLHIYLVSTKNNGNILTYPMNAKDKSSIYCRKCKYKSHAQTNNSRFYQNIFYLPAQITVPCRNILVCQPGCNIKHYNCTLPMNAAKFHRRFYVRPLLFFWR